MSQDQRRVGVYGRCVDDGAILLTRLSAIEPDAGRWTLPGGGMDFGEHPHETLVREFFEETGLIPEIGPVIDVRSKLLAANPRRPALHVVQIVYEVHASGVPDVQEVDGSTSEASWVPLTVASSYPLVDLAAWAVTFASDPA
ncbi:MAG: NUDIX hydrolase [Acidimicrobiia bacterium]